MATYDDDQHGSRLSSWIEREGNPPWWIAFLLEEYYWLEKGFLPHGDRDRHSWEYLLGLAAVGAAYEAAREKKTQDDKRKRPPPMPGGGGRRPMVHLNGPGA